MFHKINIMIYTKVYIWAPANINAGGNPAHPFQGGVEILVVAS